MIDFDGTKLEQYDVIIYVTEKGNLSYGIVEDVFEDCIYVKEIDINILSNENYILKHTSHKAIIAGDMPLDVYRIQQQYLKDNGQDHDEWICDDTSTS